MTPPIEPSLEDGLEAGLRRVAIADRLLVASDFDGTLAPIVDRPDAVEPDLEALAELRRLAELDDTRVAVVSGRSRAVLQQHLATGTAAHEGPRIILVGSHGAELDPVLAAEHDAAAAPLDSADERALTEVGERFDALAAEYDGAIVERKPTAVAFHYRQVEEGDRSEAAARARALVDGGPLRVQAGHLVVELVAGDANKGDAIDWLRRATGSSATVFVGDDRTDEHAFARLGPRDLAVKIGPGTTCAPVRIDSQRDVAPLFRRLYALRVTRG
ncbi:MAG: trehalose-phosphatase [Gemmatimonadales bacterium]|jgi:trehalose-phosphatase